MNVNRACLRACLASYVLFVASSATATGTILLMIWMESETEAHWKTVSTSLSLVVFSLLVLVGTKAFRDATTVDG